MARSANALAGNFERKLKKKNPHNVTFLSPDPHLLSKMSYVDRHSCYTESLVDKAIANSKSGSIFGTNSIVAIFK